MVIDCSPKELSELLDTFFAKLREKPSKDKELR